MIVRVGKLRRLGSASVTLGVLGFASSTHAQSEVTPLTYVAPSTCPPQEQFEAAVRARTPLARFGESADTRRRFAIEAASADGRFTARLKVTSDGVAVSDRQIQGDTCAEVIDALALVTALAIDPKASTAPLAPASAAPPSQPSTAPLPPPTNTVAPQRSSGRDTSSRLTDRAWRASLGATADVIGRVTPLPLLGATVFGEIEQKAGGWWAPSLRLTIGASKTFEGEAASAAFALGTAGVDFCPSAVKTTALSLRPCVEANAGLLHARGVAVSSPVSADRFWFDVRLAARARWSPGGGRMFVEIEGGALFPITMPTFVFRAPRIVAHEVGSVAPLAKIGVGLRFP